MSTATLKKVLSSEVAADATFTVAYTTQSQADFVDGQQVNIDVYGGQVACDVSFGASEATVTWPAGADYALPAGEYYIDFDTVGGDNLREANASQAANQADSTAADVAGIVADHNALLAKLKAAGIMVAD